MSPKLPSAAFMLSSYNDNDNGNDDDNDNYNDNPALLARKTKVIQSYLSIWGTYDPMGSDPSDPKKWGLYGCRVINGDFRRISKIGKTSRKSAVLPTSMMSFFLERNNAWRG